MKAKRVIMNNESKKAKILRGKFVVELPSDFKKFKEYEGNSPWEMYKSDKNSDISLTFQIIQTSLYSTIADDEVLGNYFKKYAVVNDRKALEERRLKVPIGQMPYLSHTVPQLYIEGKEVRSPNNSLEPPREVRILFVLLRLEEVNNDVLIWLDIPNRGEAQDMYEKRINKLRAIFRDILYNFRIAAVKAIN